MPLLLALDVMSDLSMASATTVCFDKSISILYTFDNYISHI